MIVRECDYLTRFPLSLDQECSLPITIIKISYRQLSAKACEAFSRGQDASEGVGVLHLSEGLEG